MNTWLLEPSEGGIKNILRETLGIAGKFAWQTVKMLPEAFLSRTLWQENESHSQDIFDKYIGRVAVVGEFGYEDNAKERSVAARRAAKVLIDNKVVERGALVDIRAMSPDIARDRDDPWLSKSVAALAKSLNARKGVAARVNPDSIIVPIGHQPPDVYMYASIRRALTQEKDAEESGDALVIVANPFFVAQAMANITYHDIKEGGVAVLDDVGAHPRASKFLQLWAE